MDKRGVAVPLDGPLVPVKPVYGFENNPLLVLVVVCVVLLVPWTGVVVPLAVLLISLLNDRPPIFLNRNSRFPGVVIPLVGVRLPLLDVVEGKDDDDDECWLLFVLLLLFMIPPLIRVRPPVPSISIGIDDMVVYSYEGIPIKNIERMVFSTNDT